MLFVVVRHAVALAGRCAVLPFLLVSVSTVQSSPSQCVSVIPSLVGLLLHSVDRTNYYGYCGYVMEMGQLFANIVICMHMFHVMTYRRYAFHYCAHVENVLSLYEMVDALYKIQTSHARSLTSFI